MTNNVFFLNNAQNENAIRVAAVSLLRSPVEVTDNAEINFTLVDGNLKKDAQDMIANVLDIGAIYNVIHKDARLAQAVCDVLFQDFLKEAQDSGINIEKLLSAQAPQKQLTLEEIVTMYNVEEVVIKGVNLTEKKVVGMMGAAGLVIGGQCETKLGNATVLGFEATANGVFVVVVVDGQNEPRKLMADKVKAIGQTAGVVAPSSTADDTIQAELDKLAGKAPWEEAARGAVSEAIVNGGMTIRSVEDELSEAERFEASEEARVAGREEWLAKREANKQANAQSEAAQRILAMAAKLGQGGGAAQAPKSPANNNNNGKAQRRPQQSNNNQNQGGNNMQTQTRKDQPKQSVAGGQRASRPAAQPQQQQAPAQNNGASVRRPQAGNQPAGNRPQGGAQGRTRLAAGTPGVGGNRRSAGTRLGAGAPIAGAQRNGAVVGLRQDTPIARFGRDSKWYQDASRFPYVMDGQMFEETRKNLDLGITDAKFYDAVDYAASRGYEARENDMAVIELHFGPAVRFQFNIKLSSNPDAHQPWYCSNVSFVRPKSGNGGYWTYVLGRRQDDAVLIEKKGEWVMASKQEIEKANKDELWTVKGAGWVNDTIYGMYMGEEIIAQVMRFADYAWTQLYTTQVEAE